MQNSEYKAASLIRYSHCLPYTRLASIYSTCDPFDFLPSRPLLPSAVSERDFNQTGSPGFPHLHPPSFSQEPLASEPENALDMPWSLEQGKWEEGALPSRHLHLSYPAPVTSLLCLPFSQCQRQGLGNPGLGKQDREKEELVGPFS